jgi:hypothetical protein
MGVEGREDSPELTDEQLRKEVAQRDLVCWVDRSIYRRLNKIKYYSLPQTPQILVKRQNNLIDSAGRYVRFLGELLEEDPRKKMVDKTDEVISFLIVEVLNTTWGHFE